MTIKDLEKAAIQCETCVHAKMCKYKEDLIRVDEQVSELKKQNKCLAELVEISYKCKYYSENKPTVKEIRMPDFTTTSTAKDNCKDCEFYNRYFLNGQTYIGDSPCQWCKNSPLKITCTSSTSDIN